MMVLARLLGWLNQGKEDVVSSLVGVRSDFVTDEAIKGGDRALVGVNNASFDLLLLLVLGMLSGGNNETSCTGGGDGNWDSSISGVDRGGEGREAAAADLVAPCRCCCCCCW